MQLALWHATWRRKRWRSHARRPTIVSMYRQPRPHPGRQPAGSHATKRSHLGYQPQRGSLHLPSHLTAPTLTLEFPRSAVRSSRRGAQYEFVDTSPERIHLGILAKAPMSHSATIIGLSSAACTAKELSPQTGPSLSRCNHERLSKIIPTCRQNYPIPHHQTIPFSSSSISS